MQAVPRTLLLLHPDPRFQARIAEAAGKEFRVLPLSSWAGVLDEVPARPPNSAVVVDPYFGGSQGDGPADELRHLLQRFPSVAVLAAVRMGATTPSDLRRLGEWGVAEIIDEEREDARQVRQMLRGIWGRRTLFLLREALPANLSARAREIVELAVEVAAEGQQAEDLAKRLFLSGRTLLRRCRTAGLPAPRELLAWIRILLAAELLEEGRTVEAVALACGYASDTGLRRVLRDYVGMGPRAIRRRGALRTVGERFRQALAEQRRRQARAEDPSVSTGSSA